MRITAPDESIRIKAYAGIKKASLLDLPSIRTFKFRMVLYCNYRALFLSRGLDSELCWLYLGLMCLAFSASRTKNFMFCILTMVVAVNLIIS